jgi:hypothetical protein
VHVPKKDEAQCQCVNRENGGESQRHSDTNQDFCPEFHFDWNIARTPARSRQVAERAAARADGQIEVIGLTWDRYVWPLATGAETR